MPPSNAGASSAFPSNGEPRGKAFLFLANVWANLTTLVRLFREATAATGV